MVHTDYTYPLYARILHAGMAVFGIMAFLTGEIAENGASTRGYFLHAYLGLSLAAFVLLRVMRGFAGAGPLRFSGWSPFSSRQWRLAWQDVNTLLKLEVPERGRHEGLSGLVQAFGLAIFGWMAMTGTVLFFLDKTAEGGWAELVEELHEVGEAMIPVYLALHIGSVLLHSLAGRPIWQRMWKFRTNSPRKQEDTAATTRNDTL
jgi:cytochrome b561